MSSIVKKGQTSFTPKFKKTIRRKPKDLVNASTESSNVPEPQSIDPRDVSDTSPQLSQQVKDDQDDDQDDDEDGDNDLFKLSTDQPKRKLSTHTRLSGINIIKPSSRKGSVSIAVRNIPTDELSIPIPIEVPYRKKRKSVVRKPTKRVIISPSVEHTPEVEESVASTITVVPILAPQDWEVDNNHRSLLNIEPIVTKLSRNELYNKGILLVYALNESNTKLIKYRTGDLPDGDNLLYPLAPEDVDITIKSRSQIPRGLTQQPESVLSLIKLDPGNMTLRDLSFNDLPIGKVSENYNMAKDGRAKDEEHRKLRKEIRELARSKNISIEAATELVENQLKSTDGETVIKQEEEKIRSSKSLQLQVSATTGEIDINPESISVSQPNNFDNNRTREETNPYEKPVLSTTYSKRKHTDKWSSEEEVKFFNALREWGTDFSLIATYFPYRDRKQMKAKFNSEEKKRPELIELLLSKTKRPDLEKYQNQLPGGELTTLDAFNDAMKKIKTEYETQKKEILKLKDKADKEDNEKRTQKEIERKSGHKQTIQRVSKNQLRSNEEVIGSVDRR